MPRTGMRPSALFLLAVMLSAALGVTPAAAIPGADFTLTPDNITPDGNGLINDMVIEVSGGVVTASASEERTWVDRPGSSTAKITGTYDPATKMFEATYTGEHRNNREAGDVVQDVTFTFTGTSSQRFEPTAGSVQINFDGTLTNEVTGGPSQPPKTTRDHSLSGLYTLRPAETNSAAGAQPAAGGETAQTGSASQSSSKPAGGFPLGTVLIGLAAVGAVAVAGGLWVRSALGASRAAGPASDDAPATTPSPLEPEIAEEPADEEPEEDEEDGKVVLELTYPAGRSPKVFTSGWVFGARCVVISADGDETDMSDSVEWSGSGDFSPSTGHRSRPSFAGEGSNTIELSCEAGGRTVRRVYAVEAVSPSNYASIGSYAYCEADAHGCDGCPHPVIGRVATGSSLVTANGKPAARQGDSGQHAICCGANTFVIGEGDPEVLIGGRPAARMGDRTDHCGGVGRLVYRHEVGEIGVGMWADTTQ